MQYEIVPDKSVSLTDIEEGYTRGDNRESASEVKVNSHGTSTSPSAQHAIFQISVPLPQKEFFENHWVVEGISLQKKLFY